MKLLAFSAIVGLASANQIEWMQFKELHGKSYSAVEDGKRYNIFMENKAFVARHNAMYAAGRESYTVAMNKNGDLTNQEFRIRYLAQTQEAPGIRLNYQCPEAFSPAQSTYPDNVDWTATSPALVTPVKDQGSCGSCWSFGGTGTLEGAYCKSSGTDCGSWSGISEQNLVDCGGNSNTDLGPYYDMACNGGWIDNALYYVQVNGGIDSEDSYPYVSGSTKKAGACVYDSSNSVTTMTTCGATTKNSENELMQAIADVGPIGIAIDAGGIGFQMYSGGVYISSTCSSTRLNHAVLAVGYGNLDGQDFFKVKNSWGTAWGDSGYILMARNRNNQCGVAATPAYAMI